MGHYGVIPASITNTFNEVTWPKQPAFLAYVGSTLTNVTGDGTAYTIIFETEIYDQTFAYTHTTGVFTATKTGRYYLGYDITLLELTGSHTGGNCRIVTSNRTYGGNGYNWGAMRDSSNGLVCAASFFCDMDAADTATIVLTVSNGAKDVDLYGDGNVWTGFYGALLL